MSRRLKNKHTSSVPCARLNGTFHWPSHVDFQNLATELIQVHVVYSILSIRRGGVSDEGETTVSGLCNRVKLVSMNNLEMPTSFLSWICRSRRQLHFYNVTCSEISTHEYIKVTVYAPKGEKCW